MAFRMTVWLLGLMFVATLYNVATAYSAIGSMDVQSKFQTIGLIEYKNAGAFIIPERKPVPPEMVASN